MKILVDGQTLHTHESGRGIGRYLIRVMEHLVQEAPEHTFFIGVTEPIDTGFLSMGNRERLHFVTFQLDKGPISDDLRTLNYRQQLEDFISENKIDVYWNPNPLMTNVLFAEIVPGCVNIATGHDLIPLVFVDHYLKREKLSLFEEYMDRTIKLSFFDHIIAVSQATKMDLVNQASINPNQITTIYEGVEDSFFDVPSDRDKREVEFRYGLPKDFVLTVSGSDYRKNNFRLIEALSILKKTFGRKASLVIGGELDPFDQEKLRRYADERGVSDCVMFTGYIPDGDLPVIYRLAHLFVFPSLYEGFGLPVLEAMASGKSVAVSNTSSLPEVVGKAGVYFDPYSSEDIAAAMNRLLADDNLRDSLAKQSVLRAKEFSWNATALGIARLFDTLSIQKSGGIPRPAYRTKQKLRIAFFSPLNPQPSGISDYSEALLPYLGKHAEIDLFVDGIVPSNPEILGRFKYYDYHEFDKNRYSSILYHMGNNALHEYIYRTLQKYSGITVLHDYVINPFLRHILLNAGKEEEYLKEIEDCYGFLGMKMAERTKEENFNNDCFKFPLINKVVLLSDAIIAHNDWVKSRIMKDHVFSIPHGAAVESEIIPDEVLRIRKSKGISPETFVVGCFGGIVKTKRVDVVVKAFSIFRLFYPDSKLLLIGGYDPDLRKTIEQMADQYHLKSSIYFSGRISLEDFVDYLKATDVVVNLRYPTMGESSGSLARAMSFGKPIILSNVNQFREYPKDSCIKLNVDGYEERMLVEHLIKLKKYPGMRKDLGQKAREYIKESCTWDKVAVKYIEAISTISEMKQRGEIGRRLSDAIHFAMVVPDIGTIILEGSRYDRSIVHPILRDKIYESHVLTQLKKLLKPGSIFMDVGANIGVISAVAAHLVGKTGRVIAIEPAKTNFFYLERNMQRTTLENHDLINCGAWDVDTTMELSFIPHVAGCSFFSTTGVREGHTEMVTCRTIDSLLSGMGWPHVNLVKIDVEGAEFKALQGMEMTIKNFRPHILFELNPTTLKNFFDLNPREIWDFFEKRGYIICEIKKTIEPTKVASFEEFLNLITMERPWNELLAKPDEC